MNIPIIWNELESCLRQKLNKGVEAIGSGLGGRAKCTQLQGTVDRATHKMDIYKRQTSLSRVETCSHMSVAGRHFVRSMVANMRYKPAKLS